VKLPASSEFSRLTMLEAVEYGWWYAARLPDDRLTVALASDPAIIKQAALHTPERWLARLQQTQHLARAIIGCDFGAAGLVVRVAPSFVLDSAVGDGWLAVGDAAAAYDPIASQGIYKAMLDGLQAAEVIVAWLGGDTGALDAYQAECVDLCSKVMDSFGYALGRAEIIIPTNGDPSSVAHSRELWLFRKVLGDWKMSRMVWNIKPE
jgi:flavin-dependent dehydrogenase